eukprot:749838-Prorocentrum_minimum.AAC.1
MCSFSSQPFDGSCPCQASTLPPYALAWVLRRAVRGCWADAHMLVHTVGVSKLDKGMTYQKAAKKSYILEAILVKAPPS